MDPDFLRELLLQKQARGDHELFSMDTPDLKDKATRGRIQRRKAELATWRREVRKERGDE